MSNAYRFITMAIIALAFSACTKESEEMDLNEVLASSTPSELQQKAPLLKNEQATSAIDNAFIVVFKEDSSDVDNEIQQAIKARGIIPSFVYRHAIKGFSAKLPAAAVEALRNNPFVKYIEQDQVISIKGTQTGATWGLDRVDQATLPLNGTYNYSQTGTGVDAYIFDTGIRLDHIDFGGRAIAGYDAFGGNTQDGNGHGTHVAGTVGGTQFGIAKNTRLIAVRVLDNSGSGSWSGVIAGLDWAVGHHTSKPAVGNMSLGGGISSSVDDAVRRAIADGIVMCVAAGNSTANASNYSPARVAEAVTVGATTSGDGFASYSNFGSVVDILAPGSSITSTWYTSSTATNTISGTSMATPHVAGAAALYLEANPAATPSAAQSALKSLATPNKITNVPAGTVNSLLYAVFSGTPITIPTTPTLSSPANGSTGISSNPTLSWIASSGASAYGVQVSTDPGFATTLVNTSVTSTTYAVTGLSSNTTYYWRVNAGNSAGTSAWSQVWSFTTASTVTLSAPILTSPANFSVNIPTATTLSWNTVAGAASYEVQISTRSNFSTITSSVNTSNTSVNISGLARNTNYYWRARAVAGTTRSAWSTAWTFKTVRK